MGRFAAKFQEVGNCKDMVSWEPRLPLGNHTVALVSFLGKESAKDGTVRVEGEFVILDSDNPAVKPGALHSWMWAITAPGFTGQYAQDRNKRFIRTCQDCIGNTDMTPGQFGDKMDEEFRSEDPELFGLQLEVKISPVIKNGQVSKGKNGDDIHNADWTALEQSDEDILATRETLKGLGYKRKNDKAPTERAPDPAPAANTGTGGLKKLGLKK